MEIIINVCHGGFGLSQEAKDLYIKKSGENIPEEQRYLYFRNIKRNDPVLVDVVKELKEKAENRFSSLKIVNIPDDVEWEICEYDGLEWVAEKHRKWE